MTELNLAELDRLEQEMQGKVMSTNVGKIHAQLRPLLDLVEKMAKALAWTLHPIYITRPMIEGYGEEEDKEARAALADYKRAKENTTECEKCIGTGARFIAGEPVISEACGECSGEGVV